MKFINCKTRSEFIDSAGLEEDEIANTVEEYLNGNTLVVGKVGDDAFIFLQF